MSHLSHELHEEFPEYAGKIRTLKAANEHFAQLAEEYHSVNHAIIMIEDEQEAASDFRLEELKKRRLALMDEISNLLHDA